MFWGRWAGRVWWATVLVVASACTSTEPTAETTTSSSLATTTTSLAPTTTALPTTTTTSSPPPTAAPFEVELYNGYDLAREPAPLTWARNTVSLGSDWVTFDAPFFWEIYYTTEGGMIFEEQLIEDYAMSLEGVIDQEARLYGVEQELAIAAQIETAYAIGSLNIIRMDLSGMPSDSARADFIEKQRTDIDLAVGVTDDWYERESRWGDQLLVKSIVDGFVEGRIAVGAQFVEEQIGWLSSCDVTPLAELWWSVENVEHLCLQVLDSIAYGHQWGEDMSYGLETIPLSDVVVSQDIERAGGFLFDDPLSKLNFELPPAWTVGWHFGPRWEADQLTQRTLDPDLRELLTREWDPSETPYPSGQMVIAVSDETDAAPAKSIILRREADPIGVPMVIPATEDYERLEIAGYSALLRTWTDTPGTGEEGVAIEHTDILMDDPATRLVPGVVSITCSDPLGGTRELCIEFARSLEPNSAPADLVRYDVFGADQDNT